MNLWHRQALKKHFPRSLAIFKWLIILVLVLGLTSCGEKSVSQEVSIKNKDQLQQISQQFSEVSPPAVIQELRSTLEMYRPQVKIVTPLPDEILNDNKVTVRFQVKDLPIFQHPQWELGPHLHLIVDNQPYIPVYDLEQPLVFSDLSPGTHTLRVFASRPWDESFKNEGAYAQTTFHLFTKTDDNNPDTSLPLLTYSSPQDNYGAEPILLDFYLTNAPLHLNANNNDNDTLSDWRIRCTINNESFVFDRWQSVYLKGFKPGINWVKLEFLDNQGNPVKNAFNTTVRLVNYQPKGKDTLARITRGELTADQVRGIVDPTYAAKQPVAEPTPEPQPQEEKRPTPEFTETPQPEITPTPQPTELPETATPEPSPVIPTQPEVVESPTPEPQPEVTPIPSPTISPELQPEVAPEPQVQEESPPSPTTTPEPQPEVKETESPEEAVKKPQKVNLGDYFKRRSHPLQTPE
ncbi:hypothetical protein [Nostoc sp. UHCC 0870]|uniref:hypothetical protein n=1 Tax=Nostoc sp. UHCC 0870 TaxID=2914041 RepID=UPI001EDF84E9|nr:hypothetical protein [Nostoc sp. UHCC 0870]UKO98368.1 hypothetical protein L6494_01065 [Nostoc sp. UHCC 0870]